MRFSKNYLLILITLAVIFTISINLYSDGITSIDLSQIGSASECKIADGVLYATMYGDEDDPNYGCGILAYDIENDEELWFYRTSDTEMRGDESVWCLRVYGDSVYAIVNAVGVLRIDRESGVILNTYETSGTIISPFVIGDGVLYISNKYKIIAIDLDEDEVLWRYEDEKHESGMMPTITNLYYDDGRLYVGNIQPIVRCFDGQTGDLIWSSGDPVGSYVTIYSVSDNFVYVINAGDVINTLAVLDVDTGEGVDSLEGCEYRSGSDEVFIVYTYDDHSLLAINPESAGEMWEFYPEKIDDLYGSDYAISDDLLCMGGETGILYGVDISNGEVLWRKELSDLPLRIVGVYDGVIYVVTEQEEIYGLKLPFGEVSWSKEMNYEIDEPFGISEGYVYFSSASTLTIFNADEFKGDDMKEGETNITEPCWVNTILATKSKEEAREKVEEVEGLLEYGDECGYLWIPDHNSLSGEEYYLVFLGPYEKAETSQYIAGHYLWLNPDTYCIRVSDENERETLPPRYEFRGFFPSMDRLLMNFQPQAYPELPQGWHKEDNSNLKDSGIVRFVVWNGDDKTSARWYFSVYGSYQIGPFDVLVEERFSSHNEAKKTFNKYCEYATRVYGDSIKGSDEFGYSVWEDSLIFGFGAEEKKLEYTLTLEGDELRFRMLVVEMNGDNVEWKESN